MKLEGILNSITNYETYKRSINFENLERRLYRGPSLEDWSEIPSLEDRSYQNTNILNNYYGEI